MKISDFKNEAALDLLADIIDPVTTIFADEGFKKAAAGKNRLQIVSYLLKNQQKPIIEILARLDGVDPSEYKGTIVTMTKQVLDLLNDEDLIDFFQSQGQKGALTSS